MRGKIGATEWTMSKLLTLVLGVLVLVLVIYGVSTNGFEPLKNKVMGAIDEVLILFGIKSAPPTSYDCTPRQLNFVPGGSSFLSTLKYPVTVDTKFQFTLCEGDCSVEGPKDFGKYYLKRLPGMLRKDSGQEGKRFGVTYTREFRYGLEKEGSNKGSFDYPFLLEDSYKTQTQDATEENIKQAAFYRGLYKKITEEVIPSYDLETLNNFYDKRYTKRILLWSNGEGGEYPRYFIWQNGFVVYYDVNNAQEHNLPLSYIIKKRVVWGLGFDFDKTLDFFISEVSTGDQDKVWFGLGNEQRDSGVQSEILEGSWTGIDSLAGRDGWKIDPFESPLEVETEKEKQNLKKALCKKRADLLLDVYPTEEEYDLLIKSLTFQGKKFEFEGKNYDIGISNGQYIKDKSTIFEFSHQSCGNNLLNYPYLVIKNLDSGKEIWFAFSFPYTEEIYIEGQQSIGLDTSIPLSFFELDEETGEWLQIGHQEDYKIKNDEDFVKLSNARRVNDFLLRTCRSVK